MLGRVGRGFSVGAGEGEEGTGVSVRAERCA